MMRNIALSAFCLCCVFGLGLTLGAQTAGTNNGNSDASIPALGTPGASIGVEPEPYKLDEFPIWTYDIRRGEIITVGAFPIAYLLSSLVYDVGNWINRYASGDPNYGKYTPFSTSKPAYTTSEITALLVAALCVGVVVAVIDFVLGQVEAADKAKAEKEKRDAEAAAASHIDESANPDDANQPGPDLPETSPAPQTP